MVATIVGEVVSSGIRPTRRPGFRLFELIVKDETRSGARGLSESGVSCATCSIRGSASCCTARWSIADGGLQFTNPEYEIVRGEADDEDATVHTGRIVPIYEKAGSVTPRMQRTLVHRLLAEMPAALPDPLPAAIRTRRGLARPSQAIAATHFRRRAPTSTRSMRVASPPQQRLIFEEFFLFQAGLVLRKRRHAADRKAAAGDVDDRHS